MSVGECICNQGFAGDDCSIEENTVIVLEPLEQTFCDIFTSLCKDVTLIGDNFLVTSLIQCAIQKIQVSRFDLI
jgi:hypothetical protein